MSCFSKSTDEKSALFVSCILPCLTAPAKWVDICHVQRTPRLGLGVLSIVVASYPSYLCCVRGMGQPSDCKCLALVSMNILTVPMKINNVVSLSSDKCTYCKSLWIEASAKWPQCKCNGRAGPWDVVLQVRGFLPRGPLHPDPHPDRPPPGVGKLHQDSLPGGTGLSPSYRPPERRPSLSYFTGGLLST